ncbi:MAG TPA: hypothetical protein VHE32_10940, partial [Rhodanobacteraceae bacterium]|nr:hypothetical protein [Rhodanobacteraceae bacterium]
SASPSSGFTRMGISSTYFAAWLLPALAGGGAWLALNGRDRSAGDAASAIGAGWLIGIVVAAECARLAAQEHANQAFAVAWPWLAGFGALAWIAAFARLRPLAWPGRLSSSPSSATMRLAWWLLLLWIVLRFHSLGDEASLRPVFPWDAWSAWAIKAKTWFLAGRVEPYVSMLDWLAHPDAALRTAASWNYPELLAWIELWFAGGAMAWNEPLVDLAWCGALAAFALAAYGYWRALDLAPWLALVLVYALVSLPLIDAHVALAGYADLWIAVTLGLASLAWARWLIRRERGQWVLAIAAALCLPAIKLEGRIWLFVFALFVLVDAVPLRRRSRMIAGIAVLVALAGVALVAAGAVVIHGNRIGVPSIGTFELAWHGVGGALAASLFTLPNWHLFWYLVPLLIVLRRQRFRDDPAARSLGLMLLIDFALLLALFFLTGASAWAEDFTSANRLILQLVPSVVALAAVLLRPMDERAATVADRRTAQATPAPRVRA